MATTSMNDVEIPRGTDGRKQAMLENPYLDAYNAALKHEMEAGRTMARFDKEPSGYCTCYECYPLGKMEAAKPLFNRHTLVRKYAFAVPSSEAIQAIANLKMPVMEFGAGTGYWAWMLSQVGIEVMAFDQLPPGFPETQNGYGFGESFFEVYPGDGPSFMEACSFCRDFALFLCWPDLDTPFAYDTLKEYGDRGGRMFIYIGEGSGGCTADDAFFELLESEWELVNEVDIPRWANIRDYLAIYTLKEAA